MVNEIRNLSAYAGVPPVEAGADRLIPGGPLYRKSVVLALLGKGDHILVPWTRKCIHDLHRLEFDIADIRILVHEALSRGKFRNSEWCRQQPIGPWAACDAYQVTRCEWVQAAHKEMRFNYYLKFAVGKTGAVLLLVSCHEPQERG